MSRLSRPPDSTIWGSARDGELLLLGSCPASRRRVEVYLGFGAGRGAFAPGLVSNQASPGCVSTRSNRVSGDRYKQWAGCSRGVIFFFYFINMALFTYFLSVVPTTSTPPSPPWRLLAANKQCSNPVIDLDRASDTSECARNVHFNQACSEKFERHVNSRRCSCVPVDNDCGNERTDSDVDRFEITPSPFPCTSVCPPCSITNNIFPECHSDGHEECAAANSRSGIVGGEDWFILSVWVLRTGGSAMSRIIDFQEENGDGIVLRYELGGGITFSVQRGASETRLSTIPVPFATWVNVQVISNDRAELSIYVDGILRDFNSISFHPPAVGGGKNDRLYVGKSQSGATNDFVGSMKDLFIWNVELTLDELSAVRVDERLPKDPLVSMLRAWCEAPSPPPPSPPPPFLPGEQAPPSSPPPDSNSSVLSVVEIIGITVGTIVLMILVFIRRRIQLATSNLSESH